MKIAYLCSDPGVPLFGNKGASVHVRELTRALQGLGHDVTVLAARSGGNAPPDYEVPVVLLGPDPIDERLVALLRSDPSAGQAIASNLRAILAAVSLREKALPLLRSFQPDVIYERYALFGTAGVTVARELGVPVILEVNAPLSEEQERHRGLAYSATVREIERTVLRSADHVVVVSSALERWVVSAGVQPERVRVLPNAVDLEHFERGTIDRYAVRTQLGLAGQPVVGFLGTLKPWHDVGTLVHAIALLRHRTPAPHLLVVGDGPERRRLEDLARSRGIAETATFTGSVQHADVAAYIRTFDVAVVPYGPTQTSYFSPLKLFEYFAGRRPVVAADVGDIGLCIRHGETGLLYPAGDAKALAAAISDLLGDRGRARSLGRAGREHVAAFHTWEGTARLVAEIAGELPHRESAEVLA